MSKETKLPPLCQLFINWKECSSSSGKQFKRENPADNRVIVTTGEEGTFTDMRTAIDAARDASDSNTNACRDSHFSLVTEGNKLNGEEFAHGYYIDPIIFDNVDNSFALDQEEILGSVGEVTSFSGEEEAVQLANDVPYGLVAGGWSRDYLLSVQVARRIRGATVWIWDNYAQPIEGIWGGFNQSGIGRELGTHGSDDFVKVKRIYTVGTRLSIKSAYRQTIKD